MFFVSQNVMISMYLERFAAIPPSLLGDDFSEISRSDLPNFERFLRLVRPPSPSKAVRGMGNVRENSPCRC